MPQPKFIQVHYLAGWTGALLNRDETGAAKRLPFGPAMRTRISSQSLKRRWRMADDPRSLRRLAEKHGVAGERTKLAIEQLVIRPLEDRYPEALLRPVQDAFLKRYYGAKSTDLRQRQVLLFGHPEIRYLHHAAAAILAEASDAVSAAKLSEQWLKGERANLATMIEGAQPSASLEAALFGRMVTSDVRANVDAAIHVAHAFTVHAEQPELDFFTVVDDLGDSESTNFRTAGLFDTELTTGLFYGYLVVDVALLVSNVTGCAPSDWAGDQDRRLAAEAVENLIWLIAEVSPGAKKASTAPYSRAEMVLIEAGDRQPRTLANAFRDPVPLTATSGGSLGARTAQTMHDHLRVLDALYTTGESRCHMATPEMQLDGIDKASLQELATWARDRVLTATL
ncbi:type I-E CRISPR-associated protein Cas7/Cse4/CasC [Croceibacterium ferulae]|uniref:type I-E CRISPR-associated protein Cas7/Cse4/CasC n=1 Tax=Croceibacterium ferulae TaxID=1854641 RepID=UPI000EB23CCC|nr:type I-E CRISPR-associated protein Cas7/Cse4/CasC [Croceibacterium ferulae]